MPLIRTIQMDQATRLGVWKIGEQEAFFRTRVNISPEIHHPHKRLQHFAGRYLLLELFPEFPVQHIRLMKSRKPYLPDDSFHFSISHCRDHVAAIVSKKYAVGIDIEAMQPKVGKIAHKFLGPAEQAFIDPEHTLAHQTVCWSAKEAIYKWYGLGSVDFKEHMQLEPFDFRPAGFITANFNRTDKNARLYLQYVVEGELCLAWTAKEEEIVGSPQWAVGSQRTTTAPNG
ncbi:MAG TPA: 4'-phosphopantetheinyl transferase superfamily protein [Chitinophaga sp.]|uniref:4'-phosphopantetheinyl transferase family protein n=1 Tax=Chitinophaga sp. TaxID=1869181 RepID=UPI002F9387CD